MIHKPQAEALAGLLAIIRPNDWRPKQVLDVLAENRENPAPFAVIAQAAVTAAANPAIKSPTGIFLPGSHWPEEVKARMPDPPRCEEHDTFPAHNCPCCWADIKIGERPEAMMGKRMTSPPTTRYQELLAKAQADNLGECNPEPASNPNDHPTRPGPSSPTPDTPA